MVQRLQIRHKIDQCSYEVDRGGTDQKAGGQGRISLELDKVKFTHEERNTLPVVKTVNMSIQEDMTLFMVAIEFDNAIQVSVYENTPRMGSLSLAYPLEDIINTQVIFSGRDESFASALAQIISKRKNRMVYGSVFLGRDTVVSLEILKSLIDKYLEN